MKLFCAVLLALLIPSLPGPADARRNRPAVARPFIDGVTFVVIAQIVRQRCTWRILVRVTSPVRVGTMLRLSANIVRCPPRGRARGPFARDCSLDGFCEVLTHAYSGEAVRLARPMTASRWWPAPNEAPLVRGTTVQLTVGVWGAVSDDARGVHPDLATFVIRLPQRGRPTVAPLR